MLRNDPTAVALVGFCYALAADPRQTRPRPRLSLAAFADNLVRRDTTAREDLEVLQHVEAGLALVMRSHDRPPLPVVLLPAPGPAAPMKRSHHKGKLVPAARASAVDPPWPYKRPRPPVDGHHEDVEREPLDGDVVDVPAAELAAEAHALPPVQPGREKVDLQRPGPPDNWRAEERARNRIRGE